MRWGIRYVAAAALVGGLLGFGTAPDAQAQAVLKVARGLTAENVTVLENRAVVLEAGQVFTEVSVAQPEIADVSPLSDRTIYIFGRKRGATTLTLLGEGGRLITNVTVKVEPDLGELKERLRALLPREPIEVRSAGAGIVLSGVVSGAAKIARAVDLARAYAGDQVFNMMSVGGTQQVLLNLKIAEMSRSAAKNIGISLGATGTTTRTSTLAQTGQNLTVDPQAAVDGDPSTAPFTQLVSGFGTFGAIFSIADSFLLGVTIDALEDKGFARILAEPNIVALSGNEAQFLAGGEVPVPAVDENDNISVDFKAVGVSLNFLPTVLDDDQINIHLSAEVSSIDPATSTEAGGINIFGFTVRRADTTVELKDGQSFAIAGLYQDSFNDTIQQVPFLGDLPVLGALFRSTSFQRDETELVVIVTVNLVTPTNNVEELALPTDRVAIPNEAALFWLGRTEGRTAVGDVQGQGFDGQFGYVVE